MADRAWSGSGWLRDRLQLLIVLVSRSSGIWRWCKSMSKERYHILLHLPQPILKSFLRNRQFKVIVEESEELLLKKILNFSTLLWWSKQILLNIVNFCEVGLRMFSYICFHSRFISSLPLKSKWLYDYVILDSKSALSLHFAYLLRLSFFMYDHHSVIYLWSLVRIINTSQISSVGNREELWRRDLEHKPIL